MPGRLAGKRAIIVGAGQQPGDTIGNGRAIALTFARGGAALLCVDRDGGRADAVVAEIEAAGGKATALACDVTHADAPDMILAGATAALGGIDILVYNVGIGAADDGPPHTAGDAAFEQIFAVNFNAARRLLRVAVPAMRESGGGAIVAISSLASIAGAGMIGYEVSKAALNRLILSIARANGAHGIRANAVLPGLMDTPMAIKGTATRDGRQIDEQRAARNKMVPLRGGMGSGWDTANAALFLASDEAAFITGVLLPVDGGASARVG